MTSRIDHAGAIRKAVANDIVAARARRVPDRSRTAWHRCPVRARASARLAAPTPAPNSATRLSGLRRHSGRQQDGIVPEAMAASGLKQPQPAVQDRVVGDSGTVWRLGPGLGDSRAHVMVSRAQLLAEPGVGQERAGLPFGPIIDQDPARQHADRSLQHAHILVEHQVGDVRPREQRLDGADQHGVVGPDDFAQGVFPVGSRAAAPQSRRSEAA